MKNTEYIMTAKTVEEAMAEARKKYGSSDNELSFEILEMPKKGFLGLGAKDARVKVTVTKAEEEVNLSDILSEMKSLKLSTDRDGDVEKEKPQKPREEQKKPKPQGQHQQKPEQKKAQPKPQQNPPKAKPEQKPEQKKPAAPKQTPAEVKEVKAEAPAKAEIKEIKTEAAAAKAEVKAAGDESDLPAALRRPVQKNQPQKNQKNQKKKPQPKPHDDRDGETKKKDLLSAVMGISDPKPVAPSPAVTVIPTVMKPAAPAKEEAVPAAEKPTSLADAVDAALAAIEAETPAPLPETEITPEPREETRVEFITPAEMELALTFVNTLLANMKLEARAVAGEAREGEEGPEGTVVARVEIVGDDTGILIGHHGETLDAIQYLMNLSTSRRSGSGKREFVKILLDVGNYREKREETLRALARRTAARAVKYKRNIVLEPMNPYERRIIHSEIHNIPDVSTHSVGSDENRKIVITYEGADKPKDGGRRRGGDRNRRRSDKSERTEKTERTEKPRRDRGDRPAKPVRAKSIDEVQIDLSEDSNKTFGSISLDEGVETGKDPIEEIARETEANEENLREY